MRERPLSPHLQVYRPMLSMVMSITHRITGGALYVGTIILAWWLLAAASGPAAHDTFMGIAGSFLGQVVLFAYSWALIHHMVGGLKHLWWDTGHGFEISEIDTMARASLAISVGLTLVLWIVGLSL